MSTKDETIRFPSEIGIRNFYKNFNKVLPRAIEGSELKKASASEILKMYSTSLIWNSAKAAEMKYLGTREEIETDLTSSKGSPTKRTVCWWVLRSMTISRSWSSSLTLKNQ